LSYQLSNLKQALGTLADVISEEVEHIRRVVISGEVEHKILQTNLRVEQLATAVNRQENEVSRVALEVEAVREEVLTIRAVEGRRGELLEKDLDEKLKEIRNETRTAIEDIKAMYASNMQSFGSAQ
jgi:archaellum component FlaC